MWGIRRYILTNISVMIDQKLKSKVEQGGTQAACDPPQPPSVILINPRSLTRDMQAGGNSTLLRETGCPPPCDIQIAWAAISQ